jgi:hypothetical protein
VNADGLAQQFITLYPNPISNGIFTITINKSGTKQISIYNSTGILYKQLAFGGSSQDVSTNGWPKGYYLLRIIISDGNIKTEKLVVQ